MTDNEHELPFIPPSQENNQPVDSIDLFADNDQIILADVLPGTTLLINESYAFYKPAKAEHYLNDGVKEPDWLLVTPHEDGTVTETLVEMNGADGSELGKPMNKGVIEKGVGFWYTTVETFREGSEVPDTIWESVSSVDELNTEEVTRLLGNGGLFFGPQGELLWRGQMSRFIENVSTVSLVPTDKLE